MQKSAVKDLLYGGMIELMNNHHYFYNSTVSTDFSHFTDDGKIAVEEYLKEMSSLMLRAEAASLDRRAKDLVLKGLKGETI